MNGRYAIVLKSPMGPKKGFIKFTKVNDCIVGSLDCLGEKHLISGTISVSGKFFFEGILKGPLGEEPFSITGTVKENMLIASFKRCKGSYELLGLKVEDSI